MPRSALEHYREALSDADAQRGHCDTAALPPQFMSGVADDAPTGRAEGVADGDGPAVDVHALRVEVGPSGQARERLRGEGLIELDQVGVGEVCADRPCEVLRE